MNKLEEIIKEQNWDNWKKEEGLKEYWDICEVLWCKLGWVMEEYDIKEESEHFDTIVQVQKLLSLLNEEKLKQII